jgi:ribulose-5-phosphate 4-epimerase/fuculose-1-phosphate aldolase
MMSTVYKSDFVGRSNPLDEQEVRVDVAAAYRLAAHYKLDDLIYSHVTARVPGTTDQFFIAPHGLWFDEVTASSLAKVDLSGKVLDPGNQPDLPVSHFAALLHSSLYQARPDVNATLHMHTQAGLAVSMMECGLITTNHTGMHFHGHVAYHDYEGDFVRPDEGDRIRANLGSNNVLILRSHGLVTVGDTMAAAFNRMYYMEFLCRVQIDALSCQQKTITPPKEVMDSMVRSYQQRPCPVSGYEWPAFLRLLDKIDPSFRN